jgi:hypothetical protein
MDRLDKLFNLVTEYKETERKLEILTRLQQDAKSGDGPLLKCRGITFESEYVAPASISREKDPQLVRKLLQVAAEYYADKLTHQRKVLQEASELLKEVEDHLQQALHK